MHILLILWIITRFIDGVWLPTCGECSRYSVSRLVIVALHVLKEPSLRKVKAASWELLILSLCQVSYASPSYSKWKIKI
ncbi:hypothetical protein F5X97DRAFT_289377 [Nemania serpens]|nr:hypothetical protein F5X97DRAFT_289377 [Nemania serpens]